MMVFLNGDDFVSRSPENVRWFVALSSKCCIKTRGPQAREAREGANRVVRWRPGKGITIEADPRHSEILIESVEAQSGKALKITAEKIAGNVEDSGEGLEASEASKFRSDVARMNYLARVAQT